MKNLDTYALLIKAFDLSGAGFVSARMFIYSSDDSRSPIIEVTPIAKPQQSNAIETCHGPSADV